MPLRAGWVGTRLRCARPRVACAQVLAIAALVACAAGARAQNFSTPTDISGGAPGGQPLIAVDAKDNIDVAWWTSKGVFFTRSTDGGKTFAAPAAISTSVGNATVHLYVDRNSAVYLLWQGTDSHFLLSRSNDGGSFFPPTDLTAALNMGTFSAHAPTMALDPSGNIDLVWPQVSPTGAVMFGRSTDGGATFSSPVEIGKFVYGAGAQIALGPQGDINILWSEQTTDTGDTCALHFNRSTDSGASFSPTMTLNSADAECDARLIVDSGDNISVLAFDGSGTYYRSMDGGRTFSNSQNILKPIVSFGGQLYGDSQGNIKAVVNSFPNHDILFSGSRDHGATFSKPIAVSPSHPMPASGGAFGGNDQSVAVDSSGNVNILWQDAGVTPGAGDIFFSRSSNGGTSFSAPQNVSQSPGTSSPGMAVDSAGNINVVWTAGSDRKVLFSRASVSTSGSGFTISAAPASLMALPGGTATAQVTVTATGTFDQAVSLSCGELPPGAECSFNPASLTPSKSGSTVGVAVTIPPTLSTGGFPFTLNVASPTVSQFQDMQISVGVLTGSVTPTAMTIPVGTSASFVVTVASTGGFGGQVGLACSAPAGVTCTFSPTSVLLPVDGRTTFTLRVQVLNTPATGSVVRYPRDAFPSRLTPTQNVLSISVLLLLLLRALASAWARGREGGRPVLARTAASIFVCVSLTLALATVMVSCGGARSKDTLGSGVSIGTGGTSGIAGTGGTGGLGGTGGSAGAGGTTSGGVTTLGSTSVTFPVGVLAQAGASAVNVGTVTVTVP